MAEIKLTLEETLKIKESIEWGYNYYTEELNQLGYTHQVKDNNELEVYDENGNFVGKSYLGKEGQTSTRKFEAAMEVPEQVAELSNQLLLIKISLGYSERDIALLQQENLVQEPEAKYGSKEEVPARIFPAPEHGNLKNISFEGIPSEEIRNYLKEHSWRYSRRNRAWYPGTKEAQASNEEFVKNFLQKFYPNTLSEEQIPQTLFDTIPEERETEAIPESDVNNPHSDFPDVDNQDMAEPDVDHQDTAESVLESSNEEQSSPEAIAPKTEYTFTPTVGEDGIIDYTGVEADKIRLPNKTQILNQFLPSYLPPVEIRRNGCYDIPAVKVADNQYLLKGTKKGGPIYRVSLDVYAALIDYHLKYDRAAGKAVAEYNNNALKEALENEQTEFFPLRTKFPTVPEPLSFESHCQPEKKRVGPYKYSSGRVSLQRISSNSMSREVYYFIESEIGSGTTKIFNHHQQNLEDLHQKLLDMELQHSDLESTWTKGRETAYGDSNLDESLLATYGVNIKRQNGNTLSAHEKTELKEVLNQVYSTYGDLSSITKDYGLKISHSGTTRMHASKAVGLFTPGMKALGISFGLGKDEAIYTANHEMAHFIDHLRGKEHHAWHASDIPGTLENKIAATFRQGMNTAKGDYWNRTCECFARAMEEYGKIVHIQQKHPDWDSEKINEKVSLPAYMDYTKFYNTMIPLIQEWIETTRNEMKIDEWSLPNSLDQKNIENDKITKSQSKGFREECLEILKKDDAQITDEDLAKLRSYEGAGGLGEKEASVNGVLNEFYTPNLVVKKMWELADAYVPNAITVLEPTAGTGRFAEGRNNNQFTMYEVDKTSARINQLLHPQATVINESFQKQFFDSEGRAINKSYSIPQFDLVIGNPPYGDYKDKWRGLGEGKEFDRYEEYFLSRGIDSLKNQDSLMIMIVPSGFLNSNEDKVKQAISSKGKLLDAWRLPEGVFPTTKVGTDILVFQRGSCQVQELCNGNWFKNHPEKILGEVKTRTNRFGKQEEYVDFFAGHSLTDTLNLLVPDKSIDKLLETSSNFIEETLQENQQEVANAESIHQSDRERETHLRGEGVGGQPRGDNGTNVPGQYPKGGSIVKDPTSPDSEATRKPVQQPTLQHNSPAPEGNDSQTSGSLGNQAGRQGGMESHTPPLHSSIEQLSDRLTLSAQEFSQFYTGNNFSQEEYPILLATDWQGKVDSSTLSPAQREWLASSEKYIPLEEGKFVNRNIFCSGNNLIKDPEKKADFIISQKTVEMKKELTVVNARISTLNEIALKKANLQDLLRMAEASGREMQERLDFPEKREKWFSETLAKEVVKNSKTEIIQLTAKLDTINRRLQKMGITDETAFKSLESSLEGQKEILQKQIDMVASSRDEIIAEEKIMLLEKKAAAVPFQQQVDQMVRHIIENTREAPPKEARKEEPTPRRAVQQPPREYEIQDEPPIEYPVGKYGQLELFAFEQTPSYNNSTKPLKETLETVLNATAVELPELPLTQENYEKLFDRGYVESPIETLKMGENQYQKFKRSDRNNLLAAAYMTLTQPSLILEKETYDEKAEQFKPVHVYGKSFYRKDSGNKRVVESIVIFKEENKIIISSHNKDVKDFVKQIKTADQIVYMDKEVGRVAVWLQEKATGHVPLQGINTRVINSSYNTENLVSIPSLIEKPSAITVQEPSAQYITSGDANLTKEHIWKAKAATRIYCNPVLDGKKSGLWKNFRDFKKHGVLDILGANAEMKNGTITPHGWNQLSTALQIYRDKRFETFRYLFVSPEGKIQDQLAVCSHLPGKTLSNLPSENLLGQVITHAEETGTKVVLVHNHPSGNITPSADDIRMTKTTEAAFTRSDGKCLLAGHIILDHDSYSLYQKGKEWEARMLSPYDIYDPLLKTRNPMEGITVSGPESLELVAQAVNSHDKWKEEGWVPVVFTNSSSQISAVKMYPEDFLTQNNAKLLSQLQETAKRTGAIMAFPIILDKNHISQENQKNLLDRMKAGCFTDFYLGEKDGSFRTSEDFNLIPGKNLFDEVGMEQMAVHTTITSTFQRHQKQEMESLGVFVAEEKKEYESFLGQIDDYLKRGKLPEYNRFILTQTPSILEFTGIPQNHVLLSTGVLNKARKIHGLDNKEIMDSVKGLFNPMLVFSSDKSTSEAKNDSILVITEATARNGKPLTLALELNKEMSSHRQSYVVNDIRSIHDRSIVAQNGVDILKKWTEKGLLRYYDDKKISDWLELRRVQFPLSLTKSDISTVALNDNSVKTRSQFENSMAAKIQLERTLPEKLLTPAQIRERKQELPVKHSFMVNNSFIPPMELAKNGQVQIYCSSEDLQNPISQNSQEIKPVVLEMTPKQAAVLVDASIKKQSMENRQSKQAVPLNLPAKSKMEESFFTGLKNVHPQLTRKEAEKQYHETYSMIEKELKELRIAPAIERKTPQRKDFSMEW